MPDIPIDFYFNTVLCAAWHPFQRLQPFPIELVFRLLAVVILEQLVRRVGDQNAIKTVQNNHVSVNQLRKLIPQSNHRGNPHRPRQNRRMGYLRPAACYKSKHPVTVELDRFTGQQVLCSNDNLPLDLGDIISRLPL